MLKSIILKQDLQKLQDELRANPGARVITYTYTIDEAEGVINLIFIYDKEERDSISSAEIKQLLKQDAE